MAERRNESSFCPTRFKQDTQDAMGARNGERQRKTGTHAVTALAFTDIDNPVRPIDCRDETTSSSLDA